MYMLERYTPRCALIMHQHTFCAEIQMYVRVYGIEQIERKSADDHIYYLEIFIFKQTYCRSDTHNLITLMCATF